MRLDLSTHLKRKLKVQSKDQNKLRPSSRSALGQLLGEKKNSFFCGLQQKKIKLSNMKNGCKAPKGTIFMWSLSNS